MGHRQSRIEHWGAVMARFGESGQEPAAFCREGGESAVGTGADARRRHFSL